MGIYKSHVSKLAEGPEGIEGQWPGVQEGTFGHSRPFPLTGTGAPSPGVPVAFQAWRTLGVGRGANLRSPTLGPIPWRRIS